MLLEELDIAGQPSEPRLHAGPLAIDGQVMYGGHTPEEEMMELEEWEEAEYLKVLERRGLTKKDVGEGYPQPIDLAGRGKLFHDISTGELQLTYFDPEKSETMIDPVATKGILGDSDFAIGSMPGGNKDLYNEVVWISLTDNIEFCVVFEGEWERIWFRVWKRNVDHAISNGKDILVLTKDDGTVGFNQTIEIGYLRRQGVKFVTMRTLDFVTQRRPMTFAGSAKVLRFAQSADSVFVRPLLAQTNYKGDSVLSTHWDQELGGYTLNASSEYAQVVKALLGAKASVLRAERALWQFARDAQAYDANPAIEEMVKLLLAHRAGINSGDNTSATALHWAAMKSSSDRFLKLLLANRADLDVRDTNFDATPLEWANYNTQAATKQKDEIIRALTGK